VNNARESAGHRCSTMERQTLDCTAAAHVRRGSGNGSAAGRVSAALAALEARSNEVRAFVTRADVDGAQSEASQLADIVRSIEALRTMGAT
jgi:hypothetical protein